MKCPASHHVPWIFPCQGTAANADGAQENTPPVENVVPPAKDKVPPEKEEVPPPLTSDAPIERKGLGKSKTLG